MDFPCINWLLKLWRNMSIFLRGKLSARFVARENPTRPPTSSFNHRSLFTLAWQSQKSAVIKSLVFTYGPEVCDLL